ncbi:hypothetical protein D3C77_722210 [compost metagenome]
MNSGLKGVKIILSVIRNGTVIRDGYSVGRARNSHGNRLDFKEINPVLQVVAVTLLNADRIAGLQRRIQLPVNLIKAE